MKTINTAKTEETKTYFWNTKKEVFDLSQGQGARPEVLIKIVVDAHLTAEELDVVFDETIFAPTTNTEA